MGKRNKRKGGKKNRRSKEKRRKFIRKISQDGKISGKEARKARKKGISLRKIKNRRISDTKKAQRDHDRRGRADRTPAKERPSYMPLKIKRSAERELDKPRKKKRSKSRGRSKKDDKKPSTPEIENDYGQQADDLLEEIEVGLDQPFNPEVIEEIEASSPETIWNRSTRTDDAGLAIGPASKRSKKTGTGAFKRRKKRTAAQRRAALRVNKSLNI